jgi:hypothetical protein
MREHLLAFGLLKKPASQRERRHVTLRSGPASRVGASLGQHVGMDRHLPRVDHVPEEVQPTEQRLGVARPSRCYDRKTLYDQVWSQPGPGGCEILRRLRRGTGENLPKAADPRSATRLLGADPERPEGEKAAPASGPMTDSDGPSCDGSNGVA